MPHCFCFYMPTRRAAISNIEGLEAVPFFTNETIFDELHEKPESMTVLGGGPIGCELGQAFSRLGVKVTIVHNGDKLLPPGARVKPASMGEAADRR